MRAHWRKRLPRICTSSTPSLAPGSGARDRWLQKTRAKNSEKTLVKMPWRCSPIGEGSHSGATSALCKRSMSSSYPMWKRLNMEREHNYLQVPNDVQSAKLPLDGIECARLWSPYWFFCLPCDCIFHATRARRLWHAKSLHLLRHPRAKSQFPSRVRAQSPLNLLPVAH